MFSPCFVMLYSVSFLFLQSSWRGRESWFTLIIFLISCDCISVLWLFLVVSLVGLQCVIVVFPDNTQFLFCNLQTMKRSTSLTHRALPIICSRRQFQILLLFQKCFMRFFCCLIFFQSLERCR